MRTDQRLPLVRQKSEAPRKTPQSDSSLKQCVLAVIIVNSIQSNWFIGQQGALLDPSAKTTKGFKRHLTGPADSCQYDRRIYGDNLIDKRLSENPEESRARRCSLKEKVVHLLSNLTRSHLAVHFSNNFKLTFVVNPRKRYTQLSQLMFKVCCDQCQQCQEYH